MAKFVTHDALASGLFNRNFCCGDSLNGGAWRETLGNSPAVLSLLLERMNSDILSMHVKMRKAWKTPDLETPSETVLRWVGAK